MGDKKHFVKFASKDEKSQKVAGKGDGRQKIDLREKVAGKEDGRDKVAGKEDGRQNIDLGEKVAGTEDDRQNVDLGEKVAGKEVVTQMEVDIIEVDKTTLTTAGNNELEVVETIDRDFDPVKNVTKKKEIWRLGVIIDDMWIVQKQGTEDHIDLLLRDVKGDTIQATINRDYIEKWKPELEIGKTYYMHAIGVINSIGKSITQTSTKKGNMAFTLKDLRGNVIDCTLWDSLSVKFIDFYNNRTDSTCPVLIIRHARVKEAQGSYPLQLTNVWEGTNLLFDDSIPKIKDFLTVSNSTQFYTQTSVGSQYNSDETFMKQAHVISLGDMKKLKTETFCVTVVTTSHIRVSNQGWFFYGFHDCPRKVEDKGGFYECIKEHKTTDPIIKYKLDVEVYDGDETAKFVFWDNPLDDLLGMTTKTLLEMQKKEYPRNLDDIMERKFAFRVPGWGGQASVLFCKDSKELVEKIQEQLLVAESSCKHVETDSPMEDEVLAIESTPSIKKFTIEDIDKLASLDDSIFSTPNVSATAENDLSPSAKKTPAKRSAGKPQTIEQTNLASQFSSTRFGKQIKKEKL
ncbi:hypothetical protein TSUD_134950 [Trifolium subterraneum]|uniref:Replication protein A 70 kDa DNA-binding subunit B/D first OB fold domain-containing protein n=1 Tax=Trifolium subterraneum TaxID=3900 RepID=A0A2Z6MHK1_TRISU|nr:hypothetical protein TSUD_134950 [Trifolium subterraneum]